MQENINCFISSLSDLDNCTFHTYIAETRIFHGLVKQWLLDLKDDTEEPLQAHFIFKSNLAGSLNQILCNLSILVTPLIDGFNACQDIFGEVNQAEIANRCFTDINHCIVKTGVIFGTSYLVVPSICNEIETTSEEKHQSELNCQLFQGICNTLHSMDQGLVCSSYCNMETMKEKTFCCYYILLPSDNGPMLLRHLVGLEEILPVLHVNQFTVSSISEDLQKSCQACLLKEDLKFVGVLEQMGTKVTWNENIVTVRTTSQFSSSKILGCYRCEHE